MSTNLSNCIHCSSCPACLPTFVWVHLIATRRPISLVICDRIRMINNIKLYIRTTPVALVTHTHLTCILNTMGPGRDRNRDILRIKYRLVRMPPFYPIRCCGVGFCGRRSRRPYTFVCIVPVTCFLLATVIFWRGRSDLRSFCCVTIV